MLFNMNFLEGLHQETVNQSDAYSYRQVTVTNGDRHGLALLMTCAFYR